MSCCPPGSIGFSRTTPAVVNGTMLELEAAAVENSNKVCRPAMPCYTTGSGTSHVILVFSDVYGMETGNHKSFCDTLSARLNDATVLMPDMFRGDPILVPWFQTWLSEGAGSCLAYLRMVYKLKFHYPATVPLQDIEEVILPYIHTNFPSAHISCVGFCFGGWVVGNILASPTLNNILTVGVGIHPSFEPEYVHGSKPERLAARIAQDGKLGSTTRLLLLAARNDEHMHPSSPSVQLMESAQHDKQEADAISIVFEDMLHGWVSRGDGEADPNVADQQEKAISLAVDFLERHTP